MNANLGRLRDQLVYNDWANNTVLDAAGSLEDAKLDQAIEMGLGNLRKTLLHIWGAEHVWLLRCKGEAETPWIDQSEMATVNEIRQRMKKTRTDREQFLQALSPQDIEQSIVYRDSLGSLFQATMAQMILQYCIHSAHHRAQAVNMIRRCGGTAPDLDYMYYVRRPVTA